MSFGLAQFDRQQPEREQWLAKRLGLAFGAHLGVNQFDAGVTTAEQRREAIRTEIINRKLADAECFYKRGTSHSYRAVFASTYGTPLETTELEFADSAGGSR